MSLAILLIASSWTEISNFNDAQFRKKRTSKNQDETLRVSLFENRFFPGYFACIEYMFLEVRYDGFPK